MNSLNFLSSRVIGQSASSTQQRQRSHSHSDTSPASVRGDLSKTRSKSEQYLGLSDADSDFHDSQSSTSALMSDGAADLDEKTPLLREVRKDVTLASSNRLFVAAQRLFDAITETIKVILSTLAAPGVYIFRCFRDEESGQFSPVAPLRKIRRAMASRRTEGERKTRGVSERAGARRRGHGKKTRHSPSRESITSSTSDSDGDRRSTRSSGGTSLRSARSKSADGESAESGKMPRRSIRIKLHNEDAKREKRRSQSGDMRPASETQPSADATAIAAESLKSPTSPSSHHRLTKYPNAAVPLPPRPLVPMRQPSFSSWSGGRSSRLPQKTLVLDLDETLIHSLAKGGRMSSGHMVEVRLSTPVTASAPGEPPTTIGPQHPILYYVHKRPHCDEFLRKVCKWYKLVIFTASVQEYADPVIDWLEQERKYFQARYYRQHCTQRNGAFIKDLSSIEPDLSKVMILDNSPMSYIFHEGKLPISSNTRQNPNKVPRQCHPNQGLDQRSDRLRPAESHPDARGTAIRDRCTSIPRSQTGRSNGVVLVPPDSIFLRKVCPIFYAGVGLHVHVCVKDCFVFFFFFLQVIGLIQ